MTDQADSESVSGDPAAGEPGAETGESPSNETPPISMERLKMVSAGDESFERELVELFIDSSRETMGLARSAHDDGDIEALGRAIHKLKGMSGNLGALALCDISAELMDCCRMSQTDRLDDLMGRIEGEYKRVMAFMEQHQNEHP